MKLKINSQDGHTALMFLAVGGFFGVQTLIDLPRGTPAEMGPGYFPFALSVVLIGLGLAVLLKAVHDEERQLPINWRAIVLVGLAPVAFGLTVRSLGLLPALLSSVTLAVLCSPRITLLKAVAIVLGVTVFCVTVFKFGIGVPYHLINPKFLY